MYCVECGSTCTCRCVCTNHLIIISRCRWRSVKPIPSRLSPSSPHHALPLVGGAISLLSTPYITISSINIKNMHDSGSQWLELTLCLPSFLLDLHSMKMINFRTAVKYIMRREINLNHTAPCCAQRGATPPSGHPPIPI